jgi:crotonobetainyl-CoA:carnitine CoA-transferase CaiB-like acyl-CoA transferase
VAPVLALDEVADHEQVVACGTVEAFEHGVLGAVRQPRPAPLFDGLPVPFPHTAPRLSEHADEVLAEAGYGPGEIAAMRSAGVVR